MKQARLDYFIASSSLLDIISSCNIKPGYRSDHSILELNITLSNFKRGKGIWKFNYYLLKDKKYLIQMNNVIDEEMARYKMEFKDCDKSCSGNIDYSLILEVLSIRLRGETIKYSSNKTKKQSKREEQLIKEIEEIEANNIIDSNLEYKKIELEILRESKMSGIRIRSRANWLKDGEKASKFFCNLEKHNYTKKTIKRLKHHDGNNIYNQKSILTEIKYFYEKLFAEEKSENKKLDLETLMKNYNLPRLNKNNAKNLEGKLTLTEISKALKHMKNEKSPGIDGFSAEFYKIFWNNLKHIVLHALNKSYEKGILSTTLRHGLITCLPTGKKTKRIY